MKCYYHKIDLDGKCSAAIVKRKYPDCELIGVDYPDSPDFESIRKKERIFVVDFSFAPFEMDKIYSTAFLTWIDHHKSALNAACLGKYKDCAGKREIGKAGCELTWEYLFPDEPTPEGVRLLGRYDVWDHEDEDVLPFQYAMRVINVDPARGDWDKFFDADTRFDDMIAVGAHILQYEFKRNVAYAQQMAFKVEFEGHKAWAINKALSNSKIFETFESQERPLWILFSYKAGVWKYSLRTNDPVLDVSLIAKKYGGGGHAGAAGFVNDKYLLKEV